ncbi:mPR-like GPCR protein [Thozetella sp. PMI_491]|nr:mPR-like GPCR protein [Thozetella sp. PMI_491]
MAYRRRPPPTAAETSAGSYRQNGADPRDRDASPEAPTKPADTPQRLLESHEVPLWHRTDFILTGYRPVANSVWRCLASLTYLHNETANIYSHLVPALAALAGNRLLSQYFAAHFPAASEIDLAVFHLYLTTSVVCFGISSAFHTLQCHSASYFDLWIRFDYMAIVVQILGSFISGIYVGFYCEPHLQRVYFGMITILGLLTAIIHLHPSLQAKRWRIVRVAFFVATGVSAFVPIIHGATLFPYDQLEKQAGLRYYYLEGGLMLAGVGFFASHFPESRWPMVFDIWGSSHQIFHCLVVLGAVVHFCGILSAFEWNYTNTRCTHT